PPWPRPFTKLRPTAPLRPTSKSDQSPPVRTPAATALATAVQPLTAAVGTATPEHYRSSIADIALTDLLQLLTTTRKTGALVLRSRDMIGRVHLNKGQVCHATLDDADSVNPLKVFYRLLRWTDGTFELEPPGDRP